MFLDPNGDRTTWARLLVMLPRTVCLTQKHPMFRVAPPNEDAQRNPYRRSQSGDCPCGRRGKVSRACTRRGPFDVARQNVVRHVVVTIARNGVDWDHLATWAADVGLGDGPISDVQRLSGGTQNILIRFNLGDSMYVLRRPPVNKRAQSDLTMIREAKVLTALGNTAVPHSRLVASCEDLGVMGAAFFLMEAVDGVAATGVLPAGYLRDPSWMRAIGFEAIDVLAAIGNVDYQEAGLS
jgi:hypothetical protein